MGRTSMDPGPGNGRGSASNYYASSHRPQPAESVRSHPPLEVARSSYGGSNRGSYYPPESHRSYPPPPESQRSFPLESQRSYHPPTESQRSFPAESRGSYGLTRFAGSRASLFDKIVLGEMLIGTVFGIAGIASLNWRNTGENIFTAGSTNHMTATRVLVVTGVCGMLLATICSIVIVVQKSLRRRPILWTNFIILVIATISILLGCSVFGHHECGGRTGGMSTDTKLFNNQCGYSFWLVVIAMVFSAQAIIFHFLAMRTKY